MQQKIAIKIFVNGESLYVKKLDSSANLKNIRNELSTIITNDTVFLFENSNILKSDEDQYTLQEILTNLN